MKNLLSENMLRFGTKNLSESTRRELTLKSIIETINEHGLHSLVRQQLMEQVKEDPAWMTKAKDALAAQNPNGYFLSLGIIKPGATYTNSEIEVWTGGASFPGTPGFALMAKGSKWNPSPSLTVAYCPAMYFDDDDVLLSTLNGSSYDQTKLQQILDGSYNGKTITGQKTNIFFYPSIPGIGVTASGKPGIVPNGSTMRTAFLANASDTRQASASGKYTPGGK